jgi:alkylhydroperoxidase family enzyme
LVDAVICGRHDLLASQLRTLLEYVGKLTRTPAAVTRVDVDALRATGYTDEAVLHAVEVTAYFAFVNRLADGLGVVLEQ